MSLSDPEQSSPPIVEMPIGMQLLETGSIRFSLDGVPDRDRMAVFREVFGRTVLKYDLEPLAGEVLEAGAPSRVVGDRRVADEDDADHAG